MRAEHKEKWKEAVVEASAARSSLNNAQWRIANASRLLGELPFESTFQDHLKGTEDPLQTGWTELNKALDEAQAIKEEESNGDSGME